MKISIFVVRVRYLATNNVTFYGTGKHVIHPSDVWEIKEFGYRSRSGAMSSAKSWQKHLNKDTTTASVSVERTTLTFSEEYKHIILGGKS